MLLGFDGSRAFVKDRTGTENYSYQLLKNLASVDKENKYLVYLRPSSDLGELSYLKKQENFEFKVIPWPRLWTQGGLALQTFKDKLDVLFVPAHTLPLVRRPGLKTVVTVHDLGSEYLPSTHQLKQRLYLGLMQRYQLKGATKLIAVSQATKEDLVKKLGISSEKIQVIYEGYDSGQFTVNSKQSGFSDTLKRFGLKFGEYFLFVGTIQPRKNLVRLIEAYDSYYGPFENSPKLVLAGGKGWLSDEIYQLVKLLGLEERVFFLGRVEDKDLSALYNGAIALVLPSLFEGFGLPILEAFASECPVICSDIPSLSEIAADAAVLVDPYNINDIAAGMDEFLIRKGEPVEFSVNEKSRQEFIKKGQARLKHFSWEKCARETLEVLESVVSS